MTPINGQRIFEIKAGDYWVGEDLESVKIAARAQTGLSDDDLFDDPQELSDLAIHRLIRFDEDTGKRETFRQALAADLSDTRVVAPYQFCSADL